MYIIFAILVNFVIVGFAFDYLDSLLLNTLIIVGIFILVVGTLPYIIVVSNEEKKPWGDINQTIVGSHRSHS